MPYPPFISSSTEFTDGFLRLKPYPDSPFLLELWDLNPLIEVANTAYELAEVAGSQAEVGIANAQVAYDFAEQASIEAGLAQESANDAQATADEALAAAGGAASALPDNVFLVPMQFRTITNGFTAPSLQAGQHLGQYSTLQGNGGTATCVVSLGANNYTIEVSYIKAISTGNLGIRIDGTLLFTIQTYNAGGTVLAQIFTGSIGALSAGLHVISLEIQGKNVASSGYNCLVSYVAIRQSP